MNTTLTQKEIIIIENGVAVKKEMTLEDVFKHYENLYVPFAAKTYKKLKDYKTVSSYYLTYHDVLSQYNLVVIDAFYKYESDFAFSTYLTTRLNFAEKTLYNKYVKTKKYNIAPVDLDTMHNETVHDGNAILEDKGILSCELVDFITSSFTSEEIEIIKRLYSKITKKQICIELEIDTIYSLNKKINNIRQIFAKEYGISMM